MKEKIYMDENLFDLSVLVGNWESVNLNPTIIIYRNDNSYLLSVIHMNETSRQASPATYEIQYGCAYPHEPGKRKAEG